MGIRFVRARFPTRRKRTREGSSQKRREGISQEKEAEQRSRQKRAGVRTCGLRSGLANVKGWVGVPRGFVGISLEYTLALVHRCTESYAKVTQTSPYLRLELTQVRVCLFSFLPPSRYVVFCVSVKKCEIPLAGDEKNHQTIGGPWVDWVVEIMGSASGVLSQYVIRDNTLLFHCNWNWCIRSNILLEGYLCAST